MSILPYPKFKATDAEGLPLNGGKLYTYRAGTTTAKAAYSDVYLTTAHTNPIILDTNGECELYLSGRYKLILRDSDDTLMWTMDNLSGIEGFERYYVDSTETDQGAVGSGFSLKDLVDYIGGSSGTIILPHVSGSTTSYNINTSLTIPSNIKLQIEKGAMIVSGLSGPTLTINGPMDVGLYQIFSGFSAAKVILSCGEVYPEWWGAMGDGTTDDTSAIQSCLSAGGDVHFPSGTYLVSNTGTVTYRATVHYYCLSIPSNTRLTFAPDVTIKLKAAGNSHVFINSGIEGSGNSNIFLHGPITIDCNQSNQTSPATGEQSGGLFHNITNLHIDNIKYTNVREYALRVTGITNGRFVNLWCSDSDGSGFAFGIDDGTTYDMKNCFFDNIIAEHCLGGFVGAIGNGFIFHGHYCEIGKVICEANAAGFKIQDTSSYVSMDQIIANGITADIGIKFIGTDASNRVNHISVGKLIATGSYYSGIYIENVSDYSVGQIISEGDATNGDYPGVWIGEGTRGNIDSILVSGSGSIGLSLRSDSDRVNIGKIIVRNSSIVSAGQSNIVWSGDNISIGEIISIDDQGSPTVYRGVDIQSGASNGFVASVKTSGSFTNSYEILNQSTTVLIGDLQHAGSRVGTFAADDATPSLEKGYGIFKTANVNPTTITALDNPVAGKRYVIIINDAVTTIQFRDAGHPASTLLGNAGVDWTPTTGDWMECFWDGTSMHCSVHDCTA